MVRGLLWAVGLAALASASASAGAAQQTASNDAAKPRMVCKRSTETGSLVAKRRECRTKQEWDRIAEAARSNATYEMDRNMSRPGGQ